MNELKTKLKNPGVFYKKIITLLNSLQTIEKRSEKLNFLEKFIFNKKSKKKRLGFYEAFVVSAVYINYARIKINSVSKWNDIPYLFNQLCSRKIAPNDSRYVMPETIYHYCFK